MGDAPAVALSAPSRVAVGVAPKVPLSIALLLGAMGLLEFAAENEAQYLDIAAGLANDLPRLGRMRRELRARMAQSPLMDAAGFTRDLESAYRAMWRSWCAARGK